MSVDRKSYVMFLILNMYFFKVYANTFYSTLSMVSLNQYTNS